MREGGLIRNFDKVLKKKKTKRKAHFLTLLGPGHTQGGSLGSEPPLVTCDFEDIIFTCSLEVSSLESWTQALHRSPWYSAQRSRSLISERPTLIQPLDYHLAGGQGWKILGAIIVWQLKCSQNVKTKGEPAAEGRRMGGWWPGHKTQTSSTLRRGSSWTLPPPHPVVLSSPSQHCRLVT